MPYLLVLTLILLAFWIYLARPVSASKTVQDERAVAQMLEA